MKQKKGLSDLGKIVLAVLLLVILVGSIIYFTRDGSGGAKLFAAIKEGVRSFFS